MFCLWNHFVVSYSLVFTKSISIQAPLVRYNSYNVGHGHTETCANVLPMFPFIY